ncbi:uncharacterized protein FFUJ_12423 [Fusarium fujikuroi IMI 58289]|uniref:Protein NO VEIN C-terminal domain-containing protein n=1 Tax=Gibberella fujikuroi (strain CBS 195.34 / IMI 58289 / NRRL A-6831) TaxID=1279085 RepID=S0ED73_GIBF5|nr:uncharacterized protein FFUJ_12423 [Fusarium fujikuroi IMI 58289]KLP06563.1 uncharacterized protein LW94_6883 [Fusarium fujikuroi]CCT72545.1 uncharacterized protein FFUJ_12423 [Fusarium fujikuroi IMI 58289]
MATPEEAERIVKEVTEYYGYLDHDMMNDIGRFNADYRRRIDENWLKMENAASHSIKVLARNIYGSGARFVFELLQNAEDNSFRKADKKNDPPFISFQVHPKRIVVECNEDGFTSLDLKAICSVGESTKTAKHGYVGAKGIGFKSVFIAASRVHIQSGNYSFGFRHNRNDPGLGMVRPIWVTPTDPIPSPLTRTTLYLHDQGNEDEIKHLKMVISMQFDDLQETCLLFLRKIGRISVAFYDGQGNLRCSKQFTKKRIDDYRVSLETTVFSGDKATTTSQIYHITKQLAKGLAQSESRDAATTEKARRSLTSAEVVLAFPLKSDYQSCISTKRQELFAFLPLRTSEYKFHIQSDFDTNANRQDIVTTTRRNLNIRDWIAKTFLKAVLEFNRHPTLCYRWPLFLPVQDSGHDSFWSGLDAKILSLVQDTPILRSRNRSDFRLISEVVIASNGMTHNGGTLLLDDPIKDPFISAKYPSKATKHLKPYGLRVASAPLFVSLLKRDLSQHNSKMRANTTADGWHSSVARMCSKIFDNGWNGTALLESLEVLPLRNGHWEASTSGPFYFPMTGDTEIPKGLDLKVLSKSATTNPDRREFFRHLGATEATYERVRSTIFSSFIDLPTMKFRFTFDCLRYLFLTQSRSKHKDASYKSIRLFTEENELHGTHSQIIYLPGDEYPFNPASLLGDAPVPPNFPVHFLRLGYLSIESKDQEFSLSSYKRWLCDFIGIHERLKILSPNQNEMSQPFQYVLTHRPARFLGLFEHLWLLEGKEVWKHQTVVSQIKKVPLPLPELEDCARRYMEQPEQFLFLSLEDDRNDEQIRSKWNFLTKYFGVGKSNDLEFLLEILYCIRREAFECFGGDSVLVSFDDEDQSMWSEPEFCVWDGPSDLDSVYSLKSKYKRRGLSNEDLGNIGKLFVGTLGVRNISAERIVSELKCSWNSCADEEDEGDILSLYEYLHKRLTVTPRVRASFEESPLIILKQQDGPDWHKTSDCLWSSTTPIRGKVTLEATYEDLKTLFVGKLGVKPLTVQMVYDELRQSPDSSIEGIKVALFSFNNFLQIKDGNWDPEPIKTAKIFPILYPDGTTALRFMDVDFAIADRDILRSKFFDKIALLDFKLEDVHRLRPLFTWLKIQQRYLSRPIKFAVAESQPHSGVRAFNINGRQYEATLSTASEHIDEPAGLLYTSRETGERKNYVLAQSSQEVDIINALTSIFASDRAVLVEILDDQGMIDLQFEDPDEDLNEEMMGGEQAEDNDASDSTPDPGQGTSDLALTPTHSSVTDASIVSSAVQYSEVEERASETEGEIIEIQSRTSHQVRRGDGSPPQQPLRHHSPAGRPSSQEQLNSQRLVPCNPISRATEDQRYRTIHEKFIAAARLANFPSDGAFDLNGL